MHKEIVNELKEIRIILAKLIGSSEMPVEQQFSIEALNKAAKEYQKLAIQRGEWILEREIAMCIPGAQWNCGKTIREEFGFTNFFKRGKSYYYNKNDLIALGKELKERNIILSRYIELKADQINFQKKIESIANNPKKGKGRPYLISKDLKDITTSAPPTPAADLIREDLKQLKEQFFQQKLSEYVDVYNGTHAMLKRAYYFEKYLNPEMRKKSNKWCEDFNYANTALQIVTKKKEVFIPVKDEDMIQL